MAVFLHAALVDKKVFANHGGGVLVDPVTAEVLVRASNVAQEFRRQRWPGSKAHPLHTPTMLCAHGLAWKHQRARPGRKRAREVFEGAAAEAAEISPLGQCPWLVSPVPEVVDGLHLPPPSSQSAADIGVADIGVADIGVADIGVADIGVADTGPSLPRPRVEPTAQVSDNAETPDSPVVPYLCTGLDLYLADEPTAM
jgi:hypothetical protein